MCVVYLMESCVPKLFYLFFFIAGEMKKNKISVFDLIFSILILSSVSAGSEDVYTIIDGDYIIAALLPIHTFSAQHFINSNDGIEIAEAAIYAVDLINKDESILPNVTLGIDILDYGENENRAKEHVKNLLNEVISSSNECKHILSRTEKNIKSSMIGIIGPDNADAIEDEQELLKNFQIIQIGYSVSFKHVLADKIDMRASSFVSVIPGNQYMTEAILDFLVANNWTSVQLIHEANSFGEAGRKNFMKMAPKKGVCVANAIEESKLSMELPEKPDVIICYCSSYKMRTVLSNLKEIEARLFKKFIVISADLWPPLNYYEPEIQDSAVGEIRFNPKQLYIKGFDDYFLSRNLENNKRNPWFVEFWQDEFLCSMGSGNYRHLPNCSGDEVLGQGSRDNKQNPKVPYVIESVFILAHALHDMLQKPCQADPSKKDFDRDCFEKYVKKVKFDFYGQSVQLDRFSRTPKAMKYDIHNFQLLENGSYSYVQIGEYGIIKGDERVTIYQAGAQKTVKEIIEPDEIEVKMRRKIVLHQNRTFVENTCNKPCLPGYGKVLHEDKCCWDCVACGPLQILRNDSRCVDCSFGSMSNPNKTNCIPIPIEHIDWFGAQSIIMVSVSLLNMASTAFTSIVFIKYRHTPVVKSSTKELCYIMFLGMIAANLTPFVTIPEPSSLNCALLRILPPISFTLIYAALCVKTNRIARILAISKKKFPNMNPRFLSLRAQVIFTIILICIEITICSYFLVKHPIEPECKFLPRDDSYYGLNICPLNEEVMLLEVFSFVSILILICTYYAIKTRNIPANFNEAKYIGFTMYATILSDIAFACIYFGSEFKILAMNLCTAINSLVVLILLFAPKLYVILWVPEKNTRAHFVTSNKIRCFIANVEPSQAGKKQVAEKAAFSSDETK